MLVLPKNINLSLYIRVLKSFYICHKPLAYAKNWFLFFINIPRELLNINQTISKKLFKTYLSLSVAKV